MKNRQQTHEAICEAVIKALGLPEDWDFSGDSDIQYTVHECGDLAVFVTVTMGRDCDMLPPDVTQYEWIEGDGLQDPIVLEEADDERH